MKRFNENKKGLGALVIIFCLAAAVLTVDRAKPTFIENTFGFIIVPLQSFSTSTADWFEDKANYFKDINRLKQENSELKEQILLQNAKLSQMEYLKNENDKLTSLLQMDNKYTDFSTVGAKIIAKDPGNWYNNFVIDKGSEDGLKKNMAVLSGEGLVGRILECGSHYSKVTAIIDDSNAISGQSIRTEDIGYVKGDLSDMGSCRMEYINFDAEIIEGDEIVTSNLSTMFPPGLKIGYVKSVQTDTNGLTKYAKIEPTADFQHLENVLVINEEFGNDYESDLAQNGN